MKINVTTIRKGIRYLKHYGWKEFFIRLQEKQAQEAIPYNDWYEKIKPTEAELAEQRKISRKWKEAPKISIVVPLYNTPETFLREMIESVMASTYENWELCLADGTPGESVIPAIVQKYQQNDRKIIDNDVSRVVYQKLKENGGIAENTNAAIAMAGGDYIAFLDHDDVITPDALYEMADRIIKGRKQGKEPEGKGRAHLGNEAYGDVMGEVRNEKKQLENKGTGTDSDGSLLAVRLFGSQRNIGNGSRDTGGDT